MSSMSVKPTSRFKDLLTNEVVQKAFEEMKQNQDVAVEGCHYALVNEKMYPEMLDFYRDQFCPDETINKSLHIPWDKDVVSSYMDSLTQNLSIALVSTKTGKIIGGRIIFIANRSDNNESSRYDSETYRKLIDITNHLSVLFDMFEHYKVEEMVHFFGLGIHMDYRRKGIGTLIQKAALHFIKNWGVGPVVVRGEGSSTISQRVYEKVGFECLAVIVYADHKVDGEVLIPNTGEDKTYKMYGKIA